MKNLARIVREEIKDAEYIKSLKTHLGNYPKKGDTTLCAFCHDTYTEWRDIGGLDASKICQTCNKSRWKNIIIYQ